MNPMAKSGTILASVIGLGIAWAVNREWLTLSEEDATTLITSIEFIAIMFLRWAVEKLKRVTVATTEATGLRTVEAVEIAGEKAEIAAEKVENAVAQAAELSAQKAVAQAPQL